MCVVGGGGAEVNGEECSKSLCITNFDSSSIEHVFIQSIVRYDINRFSLYSDNTAVTQFIRGVSC